MTKSKARRTGQIASILIRATAVFSLSVVRSLAFESGDIPAPVDARDMGGPGQSHNNDSGISGFDGNQGNDKVVGNAGGCKPPPPEGPL